MNDRHGHSNQGDKHGHSNQGQAPTRALVAATGANGLLLVVQVVGAIAFGSVALLADSVHQASDVVSLILAVGIAALIARPATRRYTFGYRRADSLGGLAHALLLLVGAGLVGWETLDRFSDAHEIEGAGVIVVAAAGLVVNGVSAKWLHQTHGHSLNVSGAVLHLAADALGSLAVLVGGIAFVITGNAMVDAVASLIVLLLIVVSAVQLARVALHILLDGVPPGVDLEDLRQLLLADPLVSDAHHLHVRTLDGSTLSLTGHIRVETEDLHEAQEVTNRVSAALAEFGVGHVTLQAECHPCEDPGC